MKRLAIYLLLFTSPAIAESYEDLIDRAFAAVEDDLSGRWAYTRTEEDKESTSVGRYDPRLTEGERWQLRSVDGREPTADEIEDYSEERGREHGDSDEDENELASIVSEGSADLIEETDSYWLFSFNPAGDSEDDKAFMDAVDGRLKIIKDGHYVAEITMQNRGTIKPGKGVKIKEFLTRLEFAPAEAGGPALPKRVRASVKGKAFLVVKIDESETVTFSEFEKVLD